MNFNVPQISYDLEGGNKIHLKKDPKYGYWSVNFDKGGIPELLQGQFTNLPALRDLVDYYLANRKTRPTKVKEV